jgi:hypothetical protein
LPTAGTYEIETFYQIYYDIVDGSVTNDAQASPVASGVTFSQTLNLSMITDEGLLIATGTSRYLKIDRNNAAFYILDVKGYARFEAGKIVTTAGLTAANGYTYVMGGIILQWGYQAYSGIATPVVFPITFPTACTSVHVTTNRLNSGANGYNHAGSVTTAGFSAVFDAVGGWWSAIGY